MTKKLLSVALLSALACFSVPVSRADAPVGMTVSTNSVKLLPRRGVREATTWTNGIALAQGQIVKNDGLLYMAEATIASSTNEPTHSIGVANNLRFVPSYLRKACLIQNCSTNNVWLNFDHAAELNKGIRMSAGVVMGFEDYQNAFHVVADAPDSLVTANEISE